MAREIYGVKNGKNLRSAYSVAYAKKMAEKYPEQVWALYKQGVLPANTKPKVFNHVINIGLIVNKYGRITREDTPAIGLHKKIGIVAWTYIKSATANTPRPSDFGPYKATPWRLINLKPIDLGYGRELPVGTICGKVAGLHNIDKYSNTAFIDYESRAMRNSYVTGRVEYGANLHDNVQVHGTVIGGVFKGNAYVGKGAYLGGDCRLADNAKVLAGDLWGIDARDNVVIDIKEPTRRALKGCYFYEDLHLTKLAQVKFFEYSFTPLINDAGNSAYGYLTNMYKHQDGTIHIAFPHKRFVFKTFRQTYIRQAKNLKINQTVVDLHWELLKYYAGTL
ncbi:MAG: hypothetical protein ACRC7S_04325 [Cetobacterium sp.]